MALLCILDSTCVYTFLIDLEQGVRCHSRAVGKYQGDMNYITAVYSEKSTHYTIY